MSSMVLYIGMFVIITAAGPTDGLSTLGAGSLTRYEFKTRQQRLFSLVCGNVCLPL